MNYFYYKKKSSYHTIFLVQKLRIDLLEEEYIKPYNLDKENIFFIELDYDPNVKKTSIKYRREFFLSEVLQVLQTYQCQNLMICDAEYFKAITKKTKAKPFLGYVCDNPYYSCNTFLVPSANAVFFDPEKTREDIKFAITTYLNNLNGTYKEPGKDIIHSAQYPLKTEDIKKNLQMLLDMNVPLTCDIETFSLKHYSAGIGSITFCWDMHNGVSFPVDINYSTMKLEGNTYKNEANRELLRWFFENFNNKLIFHNISFDVYVLIYQLYMKDLLDTEGLIKGLNILLKDWDDTKLIAYLATNSCAETELGLKHLAQEFAGNYALEEIKDITQVDLKKLLEYNLVDGLSTWFVHNKYWNRMIQDNQLDIYTNIFKPATKDIIHMQLCGMPLNMDKVLETEILLEKNRKDALNKVINNSIIKHFEQSLNQEWVDKRNKKLKVKKVTLADANEEFNPNSAIQLQQLLYKTLNLPIIDLTKSKAPATGAETLEKLKFHTKDPEILNMLEGLIEYKAVDKILTAFIPTFKEAPKAPDGWHYLFGNFNLGGTVSGRLSSSDPNLQQIPATGSKYAKPIKSCFQAPPGWLFVGLDFNALEDHISALTTKDPNKLKVYLDHYDGHCLRAYSYFKDKMPDITEQLNELKKEGKVFKVTLDDGTIKYFNENNPEFIKLKEQ